MSLVGGGETVDDLVLGAKVRHMFAREVGFVVGENDMGKPEVTKDVLPKERHYLLSRDLRERHRFYPLGEVVSGYQKEPELGKSSRERAHHIESPLHEGPRALQSVKVFARPAGEGSSEPLAL